MHQVLSIWKLRPEQTIMVGDMLNRDVIGSKRAGIYSIWLTPYAGNVACNERFKVIDYLFCLTISILPSTLTIRFRLKFRIRSYPIVLSILFLSWHLPSPTDFSQRIEYSRTLFLSIVFAIAVVIYI